ncbi:hypothetical protein F4604DRAFT_1904552 [Suillus subluteus]|nr:hypothetical protein F4604DRAFT_1904552 [Suillus subluteus]
MHFSFKLLVVVTTLAACMSVTAAQCKPTLKVCDTNNNCCSHNCAPVKPGGQKICQ